MDLWKFASIVLLVLLVVVGVRLVQVEKELDKRESRLERPVTKNDIESAITFSEISDNYHCCLEAVERLDLLEQKLDYIHMQVSNLSY